ncbi:MAG: N-acetylmuramoyl-L-alanine amidase [Armatimonadetes bacterium]|nr:N-acetylmuramoyl-L-alanine amidase [Armatimonadota bacterium]
MKQCREDRGCTTGSRSPVIGSRWPLHHQDARLSDHLGAQEQPKRIIVPNCVLWRERVQAIGLPDRGARRDSRIAPRMGFSVLRNAQVPAVLVEVGYLNHPGDAAKLGNPKFRQRAAEGIMAGLHSYFSRNQQSARRSMGR